MKIITIEEHIAGVPINRYLGKYLPEAPSFMAYASVKGRPYQPDMELYCDMDKCRIADMDKHGITMQILSCPVQAQYLPPSEAPAIVRDSNDYIAEVMNRHPDRYGAFALLPWSNPEEAVKEVQRVKSLGFHGIILAGGMSADGEFLDHERYSPVLEACEATELPIYVHL